MIPGISFNGMHSGSDIANAYMQDRALREQAIRELGTNVANSINIGFSRRNENLMQERQLAQSALEAQSNRDLQEKLAFMSNDTALKQLDLSKDLGFSRLGLDTSQLNEQIKQNQINNILNQNKLDLDKELGLGQLNLSKAELGFKRGESDRNFTEGQRQFNETFNANALNQLNDNVFKDRQLDIEEMKAKNLGVSPEDLYKVSQHAMQSAVAGQPINVNTVPPPLRGAVQQSNTSAAVDWFNTTVSETLRSGGELNSNNFLALQAHPLYQYLPDNIKEMVGQALTNKDNLMISANGFLRPYQSNWMENKPVGNYVPDSINLNPEVVRSRALDFSNFRGINRLGNWLNEQISSRQIPADVMETTLLPRKNKPNTAVNTSSGKQQSGR